jgi:hypothetical protein
MRAKEPKNPDSSKPKLSSSKTHSFPNSKNTRTHKLFSTTRRQQTLKTSEEMETGREREREKRRRQWS